MRPRHDHHYPNGTSADAAPVAVTNGTVRPMHEALRCRHCGEVIGVYEPLIAFADGDARLTRAAEPELPAERGGHYHGARYVLAHEHHSTLG